MNGPHPTAVRGFGHDARTYSHGRPGFPPEALDWLVRDLGLSRGDTVVELGAGTGKFTALLAQTGVDIVAVEPVAAMLEQLAADLPGVRTLAAHAAALPIADETAHAVICAQSFHWFANAGALAEIHRVLKPGGVLGLVWNVRDRRVHWVDRLSRLVDRHEGDAPRYDQGEWSRVFPAPGFGPLSERSVAHAHVGSPEQVIVQRIASVSFIAALPEEDRSALLDEVRALIATEPELAGKPEVGMPYLTRMFWCVKTSGPSQADGCDA